MVAGGDLFAGGDGADGVDFFFFREEVPVLYDVGKAGVVYARDGGEDAAVGGGDAQGVGVGAEDGGERVEGGFREVVVQAMIEILGLEWELFEGFEEVGFRGVFVWGGYYFGADEKGLAYYEGSGSDFSGGDETFSFSGKIFDLP